MVLTNGNEIFNNARKGKYAVGAFNINDLEWTRGILAAAQETQTPILVQTSMGADKYLGGSVRVTLGSRDIIDNGFKEGAHIHLRVVQVPLGKAASG